MPGYAPRSFVAVAPDPAISGDVLHVLEDYGAVFPGVPFVALLWYPGTTPVAGDNAEYIQVINVAGDRFTVVRADEPIEILAGMHIVATEVIPHYERGDTVTLVGHFGEDSEPYTVHVRDPQGSASALGSAHGVTHDGEGNAFYSFEPLVSGEWGYRWSGSTGHLDDNHFFVDHSDVL